jgi:proline dehydrogenase
MRKVLLAGSTSPWLRDKATRASFVKRSVRKFMPGEQVEDALTAARQLQPEGITTILTKLGEELERPEDAEDVTRHYLDVFDKVAAAGLDAQVSVKPTQLGLNLSKELCYRNIDRLIERCDRGNNLLWIDMESSPYVDPTLELYRYMLGKSKRVGVALQAYLYRTMKDIESLIPLGPSIRIVKGAYLEPPDVAYPKKADVDENFYRSSVRLLQEDAQKTGSLLHIATHDVALQDRLGAYVTANKVPPSSYEYAMLYGIGTTQQMRLAREGRRLRVLISYGEYWFPWYMRRLAERPANVWFVVKNLAG